MAAEPHVLLWLRSSNDGLDLCFGDISAEVRAKNGAGCGQERKEGVKVFFDICRSFES